MKWSHRTCVTVICEYHTWNPHVIEISLRHRSHTILTHLGRYTLSLMPLAHLIRVSRNDKVPILSSLGHSRYLKRLKVHLDIAYIAENWKHCNKIIFKCVNNAVRFIFIFFLNKVLVGPVNSARDPLNST